MTGLVALVGAGAGDPELLTLKAVKRLEEADLVLYDALLDTGTLQFARRARRLFCGKRAGRPPLREGRAAFLCGKARGRPRDPGGRDHPPHDSGGSPRAPDRQVEVRRSLRVWP